MQLIVTNITNLFVTVSTGQHKTDSFRSFSNLQVSVPVYNIDTLLYKCIRQTNGDRSFFLCDLSSSVFL